MSKQKLFAIIEGAIIIALGILIAIYGPVAVLDTYVGIVAIVLGAALLIASIVSYSDTKALVFSGVALGFVLISVGIGLLVPGYLSLGILFLFLVFALIGLGVALMVYGSYLISKKFLFTGVGQIVIGALLVVFSFLYLFVPEFQDAFWIIVGILIALYGVFFIVAAFLEKKKK